MRLFTGKPSFTKKQADLFFPPDFADDFPVAMQVLDSFSLSLYKIPVALFVLILVMVF